MCPNTEGVIKHGFKAGVEKPKVEEVRATFLIFVESLGQIFARQKS